MADLSQLSDADLQAMYQKAQTPAASPQQADLSKVSNEDLIKMHAAAAAPQGNPGTAVVAGLANAGASTLESGVDAALWLTDKLGITDPKVSAIAKNMANKDITSKLRSNVPGAPDDAFTQSAQQYPGTAKTAEYGLDTGLLLNSGVGNILKAPEEAGAAIKAGTGLVNLLGKTAGNALVGAGTAGPDTQSQDLGATVAGALTPLGTIAGNLISKAAKSVDLPNTIKTLLGKASTDIANDPKLTIEQQALKSEANFTKAAIDQNNANYQKIKDLPGTINASPIQTQVGKILSAGGEDIKTVLDTKPINILNTIQQDAANMKTMEDAVQLRQYISANKGAFQGSQIPSSIFKQYNELKNTVDGMISTKAEKAGLGDAFSTANAFHEKMVAPLQNAGATDRLAAVNKMANADAYNASLPEGAPKAPIPSEYTQAQKQLLSPNMSPQKVAETLSRMDPAGNQIMQNYFLNNIFKDVMSNPEAFNKNSALMKLNTTMNKYKDVLSPQTMKTYQGVQTVLKAAGAVAKTEGTQSKAYLEHYAGHILGAGLLGSLGAGAGYKEGGGTGAAIGGIAGIAAAPGIIGGVGKVAKGLLETPLGQHLLRYIADNPEAAKQLFQGPIQAVPAMLSNKQEAQ